MREAAWESYLVRRVRDGGMLLGICAGFRMLGPRILDPRALINLTSRDGREIDELEGMIDDDGRIFGTSIRGGAGRDRALTSLSFTAPRLLRVAVTTLLTSGTGRQYSHDAALRI